MSIFEKFKKGLKNTGLEIQMWAGVWVESPGWEKIEMAIFAPAYLIVSFIDQMLCAFRGCIERGNLGMCRRCMRELK